MKPESIRVDAGQKNILINGDEKRVLTFNPLDVLFAEEFYALLADFDRKDKEYQKRLAELEESKEKDKFGLPENLPDSFALMHDMVDYLLEKVDLLFGEGTALMVFEENKNLEMIQQFFEGMVPFIQQARTERVEKYTKPKSKK